MPKERFAKDHEEAEQCVVRLNLSLIGRSWTENLISSLVIVSLHGVDNIVQHLGHNTVNSHQQGLGRAYLSMRVPCRVVSTPVSGVSATSIRWKDKRCGDDG